MRSVDRVDGGAGLSSNAAAAGVGGPKRWRWVAFGLEGGLLVLALGLGWLLGIDPWATWVWDARAAGVGLIGVVPPLALLVWIVQSTGRPAVELRELVRSLLVPAFSGWRVWELVALAGVAGLSEEVLFRGVIQAGLGGWLGAGFGLMGSALLFGLAHWLSPFYAGLAMVMGLWFGLVWLVSGSLVAPVLAHALYDAVALVWLVGPGKEERRM
jgi:uncharacterized protein